MHRIPETIPITCHQVGTAPFKEWRPFSTCFPNTAQLIRYSFMVNYCAVSAYKCSKKERTYRSTLCGSLPPPSPIFHASISQILLCNKAEIKRLAGTTQIQWELKRAFCLRGGGIAKNVTPWFAEKRIHLRGSGLPFYEAALWLCLQEMLGHFHTPKDNCLLYVCMILRPDLIFEGHVVCW